MLGEHLTSCCQHSQHILVDVGSLRIGMISWYSAYPVSSTACLYLPIHVLGGIPSGMGTYRQISCHALVPMWAVHDDVPHIAVVPHRMLLWDHLGMSLVGTSLACSMACGAKMMHAGYRTALTPHRPSAGGLGGGVPTAVLLTVVTHVLCWLH